jgi:hypothetical protein
MKITGNSFHPRSYIERRLEPPEAVNVHTNHGSQILRTPPNSRIRNVVLCGGATRHSAWATLRGAVLKFNDQRVSQPACFNGNMLFIPSGHTLMDRLSFEHTRDKRNAGRPIPHSVLSDPLSAEDLYLVHASYCHPDQLFLPQGTYTVTIYSNLIQPVEHLKREGTTLYVKESELPKAARPLNILAGLSQEELPQTIIVELLIDPATSDGGTLILTNKAPGQPGNP